MARDENLPFARGDTLFGINGSETITQAQADQFSKLLGKKYKVEDPDYDGMLVELMVVQYDGTGALTADARFVDFSNANLTIFSDLAPAAGSVAFPLDHKYEGLSIRDLDYCYVVTGGYCEVEFIAAVTAGDNLSTDTAGKAAGAAAGDNFVAGVAIDAGGTNTNATIWVNGARGIE